MNLPWRKSGNVEQYVQRLNALKFLIDENVRRYRDEQKDKIEQAIDAALNFSKMPAEQKVGYVQALRWVAGDIFAPEIRELEAKISASNKKVNEKDFYEEVSRIP